VTSDRPRDLALLYGELEGLGVEGHWRTKDFPPWPTVSWYFTWWHDDGTVKRVHDAL
jgi:hypothetical protein